MKIDKKIVKHVDGGLKYTDMEYNVINRYTKGGIGVYMIRFDDNTAVTIMATETETDNEYIVDTMFADPNDISKFKKAVEHIHRMAQFN